MKKYNSAKEVTVTKLFIEEEVLAADYDSINSPYEDLFKQYSKRGFVNCHKVC